MKDKKLEAEIKERVQRVERELAQREFMHGVREDVLKAVSGILSCQDIIEVLTEFIVDGFIVTYGEDQKGKLFFNNVMSETWDSRVLEFKETLKEDGDALDSIKSMMKEILKEVRLKNEN